MKLLDTEQAAKYLFGPTGKGATLNQWRYRKVGPQFIKLGKTVRYRESDLNAYLNQQTHSGTSHQGLQTY